MKLPNGFEVDEVPDAVKLQAEFGSYETKYEVKAGELIFTRSLSQKAATIHPTNIKPSEGFLNR